MLGRWLGLAALAAAALALAGCGGVSGDASDAIGSPLTVYSSLPLQGPLASDSTQIVDGEKLALEESGGRAGKFRIAYFSLDDANPATGVWSPEVTAGNAKTAAQDPSTIAYIGDLDSGATAVSLPLMNSAGILQVSPSSPYIGLTSSVDAGQDEPERFYPSGKRNFGRLQPGDGVEGAAQAQLMRSLGVSSLYVLDNQDPFQVPLATIVASDAESEGITVRAHDSISMPTGGNFTGEVEKIVESKAQAVFLAGEAGPASAALWQALHTADPGLLLFGSSAMAQESFASQIGAAAGETYLTTPLLAPALYPPTGQRVIARLPHPLRRGSGAVGAVWLRGDADGPGVGPERRVGRQRSRCRHRPLLRHARASRGDRAVLDQAQRRNELDGLRRRPRQRRPAGLLSRPERPPGAGGAGGRLTAAPQPPLWLSPSTSR